MRNSKITVGILFGGKSAEHDVSIESAKHILKAIDRTRYCPVPIGIDRAGKWLPYPEAMKRIGVDPVTDAFSPNENMAALTPVLNLCPIHHLAQDIRIPPVQVVFPVLHGPMGEDGTIQGLLRLAGIPFVGADVLGSAIGMDKDVMKRLLRDAGLPIAKFKVHHAHLPPPPYHQVTAELGSPFFVKPSNLGSSIGISKVNDITDYMPAVENALSYDTKSIFEALITGRELECAVMGDRHPRASVPGEVILNRGFYSYKAKYFDPTMTTLKIPADIPISLAQKVMDMAVKAYKALCCRDLGRVDFFLEPDGNLVVNEINTIPGFTAMSMYPKLWEASGISSRELVHQLIQSALVRHERETIHKDSP